MPLSPRQFDFGALRSAASLETLENDRYYGDSERFPDLRQHIDAEVAANDSGKNDYELMHRAHEWAFDPDSGSLNKGHTLYGNRPVYRQD